MADFIVKTDKPTYRVGDSARIEVSADWGDPKDRGGSDLWATVTIESEYQPGKWGAPAEYPSFPLHELDRDGPVDMGWICHALPRGTSGKFRASTTIYEPERQEVGQASCEFVVEPS